MATHTHIIWPHSGQMTTKEEQVSETSRLISYLISTLHLMYNDFFQYIKLYITQNSFKEELQGQVQFCDALIC